MTGIVRERLHRTLGVDLVTAAFFEGVLRISEKPNS
jgi:hypothetical protein